jgi:hypothetical protein
VTNPSLIVSVVALVVSVSVAGWNVLKYILDGGRVRVRLERGRLDEESLHSGPFRSEVARQALGYGRENHVEVGVLRVENLGRTAVTIHEPAFDIGWRWSWSKFRIWRWTVSPVAFPFREAKTDTVVRLDPFDFATFILDVDPALRSEGYKPRFRRRRVIRASVRVAGKRLRRRSSQWSAWRIPMNAVALTEPVSLQQAVFREVFRASRPLGDDSPGSFLSATYAAHLVKRASEANDPLTVERLTELIEECGNREAVRKVSLLPINLHFDLVRDGYIDRDGFPARGLGDAGAANEQ